MEKLCPVCQDAGIKSPMRKEGSKWICPNVDCRHIEAIIERLLPDHEIIKELIGLRQFKEDVFKAVDRLK